MSHNPPHLNAYHLKESLNFQFILYELILAFEKLEEIGEMRKILEHNQTDPSFYQHLLNELTVKLRALAGATPDYNRLYSWDFDYGFLTKLKHYCAYFCVKLDHGESYGLQFERYGSQSWIITMEILDLIRRIQLSKEKKALERGQIIALLKKLERAMHRFAKQIVPLICEFSDDEHVIYFLIRHQKQMDRIYGKRFLVKLLDRMHSRGVDGIGGMVLSRYRKRGFHDLIPCIKEKIAALAVYTKGAPS